MVVCVILIDLRLSSRIDAVAQRVNTAVKMKSLTKDMKGIVHSMESVMKSMDVEKISAVMDKVSEMEIALISTKLFCMHINPPSDCSYFSFACMFPVKCFVFIV